MADNGASAPADAPGTGDPSTANLRIITLAHGSNRENDLLITVPLEYTIGELKHRMKFIIAGQPPAEQQRLIYLGRPLLDSSATLRSILRLQGAEQTTHSLHLVIRPNATSVPTATQSPGSNTQPAPQARQAEEPQARNAPQIPQLPNLFQNMLNPAHFADHQANIIQQHMAIHNQHVANLHHGMPQANIGNIHHIHGLPPGFPGPDPAAVRPNQNERTSQDQTQTDPLRPGPNLPSPTFPSQQHGMTMRVQESIGPNGERIRVVTNSTGVPFHRELHNTLQANPVERSASAPGTANRSETPGPPHTHRTTQHAVMPTNVLPIPHRQFHLPLPMTQNLPHTSSNAPTANPTVWLLSSPSGPHALLFAPGHGYFSTTPTPQTAAQPSRTSTDTNTTSTGTSEQQPRRAQNNDSVTPGQNQNQDQGRRDNVEQAQPRADLVLRPENQPQAQAQAQAPAPAPAPANQIPAIQNREGNEIAAFVIQRGWLFLRLYMFIFVLSEPGTWRRIILLAIATLICFLPQQNPLTDAFNVVRQHFDNLVGPPQPIRQMPPPVVNAGAPGNAVAAQRVQPENPAQNGERLRTNAMPTPEEHARRLLRDYQGRDQNFIRALFHPIEQAVALFLASLIPGVGERHVRAREEARQVIAEEQRRQAEAEAEHQPQLQEAVQQATNNEIVTEANNAANETEDVKREEPQNLSAQSNQDQSNASSTGVDVTASESNSTRDEGVRQRNNEPNQAPPNLIADW